MPFSDHHLGKYTDLLKSRSLHPSTSDTPHVVSLGRHDMRNTCPKLAGLNSALRISGVSGIKQIDRAVSSILFHSHDYNFKHLNQHDFFPVTRNWAASHPSRPHPPLQIEPKP
jgi:hypothetical protein